MISDSHHLPVMSAEVLAALAPAPGKRLLDCTVGGGGHAAAWLEATRPDGRLLGLDQDPAALERCARRLACHGPRVRLLLGRFGHLATLLAEAGEAASRFEGALFDLGISSDQLDDPSRGLSFQQDGPLDMRLSPDAAESAADLVNDLPEQTLADLIYRLGEEPFSRRIARAIVQARPLVRSLELAQVVARAVPAPRERPARIHPATRTFQALRIAVNDELGQIGPALEEAVDRLAGGGRLAVISFHSLEDRIVKQTLRRLAEGCSCPSGRRVCVCEPRPRVRLLSSRPVLPSPSEIARNPRARSAKLRAAESLGLRPAA